MTADKPKKITTYVVYVGDMSGSMESRADDVRGGFNAYIADLLADKAANGTRYRVSVTLFDDEYMPLCRGAKLADVPKFTAKTYLPRGSTALLDAVGRTVTEFGATQLGPDDRVLLVIATDGFENASREWTWKRVQELLEEKERTGQWSIVYLGQGRDAWAQGMQFGASTQTVNTAMSAVGVANTYKGLSNATVDYANTGITRGVGVTLNATPGINDES